MKKIILIAAVLIGACVSQKPDEASAKNKVAELLELIKNHQYDKAQDLYSSTFMEEEPADAKVKELQQIANTTGDITSYEFMESKLKSDTDENLLIIKYKVKCTKTNLVETFGIIIEDGKYKIASHR